MLRRRKGRREVHDGFREAGGVDDAAAARGVAVAAKLRIRLRPGRFELPCGAAVGRRGRPKRGDERVDARVEHDGDAARVAGGRTAATHLEVGEAARELRPRLGDAYGVDGDTVPRRLRMTPEHGGGYLACGVQLGPCALLGRRPGGS
ncbi:MAG TPA: hypothetical protein VGR62_06970 [Candidatus Binatia bacterium]|nr:hypothetical protein [Candidatus Binatia bacterium]